VKKVFFGIFLAAIILASCGSSPAANAPDDLDMILREVSDYLNGSIPPGRKIAFINVQSDSAALTDYIIDVLIANAVNDRVFSVVDRQQLDAARAELNFNMSGEVSDQSAQSVGKMLGAQTIITGRVTQIGDRYRLNIRALETETVQVQGSNNWNLSAGATITALMTASSGSAAAGRPAGGTASAPAAGVQRVNEQAAITRTETPAAPAAPTYRIGDTGPAGGLVFYDKGSNTGGWRYLEASPADLGTTAIWMPSADMFRDAHRSGAIPYDLNSTALRANQNFKAGSGLTNTQDLMAFANANGGGFGWAVQLCDELSINGFDDWFLPSYEELNFMYGNLHRRGLGNFRGDRYWSSTANYNGETPFAINFADGSERAEYIGNLPRYRVRAARRF
jgi:TolB-like protein